MENATKRIRKARRQGLAENGKALERSPRIRFSGANESADLSAKPRATARRRTTATTRQQKRTVRGGMRRAAAAGTR